MLDILLEEGFLKLFYNALQSKSYLTSFCYTMLENTISLEDSDRDFGQLWSHHAMQPLREMVQILSALARATLHFFCEKNPSEVDPTVDNDVFLFTNYAGNSHFLKDWDVQSGDSDCD